MMMEHTDLDNIIFLFDFSPFLLSHLNRNIKSTLETIMDDFLMMIIIIK